MSFLPEKIPEDAVRKTLLLACPLERAFEVFTTRMGQWWLSSHHVGEEAYADIRIEAFAGGAWYQVDQAGVRCPWGRVLAFDPPHRLVLAWHLNGEFMFDPDPSRASEVELRFFQRAAGQTEVLFEHRHLRRHGPAFIDLTRRVGSDQGWGALLGAFVQFCHLARSHGDAIGH